MNSNSTPFPGAAGVPGVVKTGMQPPKNENAQVIMSHVAQVLQNQGTYGGWKGEVAIKTRAMMVYQMYVSRRARRTRFRASFPPS